MSNDRSRSTKLFRRIPPLRAATSLRRLTAYSLPVLAILALAAALLWLLPVDPAQAQDETKPKVSLALDKTSISENGGVATVTATLSPALTTPTTITVSAVPVSPAAAGDFALSANQALTIAAGKTASTGLVTITARDNHVHSGARWVRVSGNVTGGDAGNPLPVMLRIADDDESCRGSVAVGNNPDPGLVADCEILLAAMDTLLGPVNQRAGESLGWSKDTDIDNWIGVTDDSERVTKLELSHGDVLVPRLRGSIPPMLGSLSGLTHLELSFHRQLTGSIPPELGNLSRLEELKLGVNGLSGPIPPELGKLSNLKELNLSYNRLSGPIPPELARLGTLDSLGLGDRDDRVALTGKVTLELSPAGAVSEGGGAKIITVTATLDEGSAWANRRIDQTAGARKASNIEVSFAGSGASGAVNYGIEPSTVSINIPQGENSGTGIFVIKPVNDNVAESDETVRLSASGKLRFFHFANTSTSTAVLDSANMPTITITDDDGSNTTPTFDEGSATSLTVAENSLAGANVGTALAVTEPDGDTLTHSLLGSSAFTVDGTGQVKVASGATLDYETTASHQVTVTVSDGKAADGSSNNAVDASIAVTIAVTNMDESGTVEFNRTAPWAGIPLEARLTDPDGSPSGVKWTWARADARSGPYVNVSGATGTASGDAATSAYTPTAADAGKWLRATASYTDGHGPGKKASVNSAAAVFAPQSRVTLKLSASSINEGGANDSAIVSATLSQPVNTRVRVDILTAPAGVVALSSPGSITFAADSVTSPDTVTITAVDDDLAILDQEVTVTGRVVGTAAVAAPGPVRLMVVNDDAGEGAYVPTFGAEKSLTRSVAESASWRTWVGAPIRATDQDGDSLTYEISGADARQFNINAATGQIQVAASGSLDFERPGDSDKDNSYVVTVTVTDGEDASGTMESVPTADDSATLTISVLNIDESGVVGFDHQLPLVDSSLTATVSDPDGGVTNLGWTWETSPDQSAWTTATGTVGNSGLTGSYTPVAADQDRWLRATASYTDGEGTNKTASGISASRVRGRGVTLSVDRLSISEGEEKSYTVALDTKPSGNVTVTPRSADTNKVTVSGPLVFTTLNWRQPQLVTVTGVQDLDEANETVSVSHQVSGANYGSVTVGTVTVTVDDDDRLELTLTLSPPVISEDGGIATVTVTLSEPVNTTTTVTVSAAPGRGTTASAFNLSANKTLTVAAGETASAGAVTVTAYDNSAFAANKTAIVSGSVTGTAADNPDPVTLTIAEDDYNCSNSRATPSGSSSELISDCQALLASRDVLRNTANLNWSTDTPIDRWDGVYVPSGDNVAYLTLYTRELSGSIPTQLGSLSNLQYLALNDNGLQGAIPTQLGSLSNLQGLYLNDNGLQGAIPTQLGSLSNLQYLYLNDNGLSGEIPEELANLTSLLTLYLGGNRLDGEVSLAVSPTVPVSEGGGAQTVTVTATLDKGTAWANKFKGPGANFGDTNDDVAATSSVTVAVSGDDTPGAVGFEAVAPFDIIIRNGASSGEGRFTLTPDDDTADEIDGTVRLKATGVGAKGSADVALSAANEPTITITDDDDGEAADTTAPTVSSVAITSSPAAHDSYAPGETITMEVTFSEPVKVTGAPCLLINVGELRRPAAYASGSGSNKLRFSYTVVTGDRDKLGVGAFSFGSGSGPLRLSCTEGGAAGTIRDDADNDADLRLRLLWGDAKHKVGGPDVIADRTPPTITGMAVVSSPASGDTYRDGETIKVQVTFSEPVVAVSSPRLAIWIGNVRRELTYREGTSTDKLTFGYEVRPEDRDNQGISVRSSRLPVYEKPDWPSITDSADNFANVEHELMDDQAGHKVAGSKSDATAPTVERVETFSAPGPYVPGQEILIRAILSEPVQVSGTPYLELSVGGEQRTATYRRLNEDTGRLDVYSSVLPFYYRVTVADANPLAIGANSVKLPAGASIRDWSTNDAVLTHDLVGELPRYQIFRTHVTDQGVSITSSPADGDTYRAGETIRVSVRFNRKVTVTGVPTLVVRLDPRREGDPAARYSGGSGTDTLTFDHVVVSGDRDWDGIKIDYRWYSRIALGDSGSIKDEDNNDALLENDRIAVQKGHKVDGGG